MHDARRTLACEAAILVALLIASGALLVPSHWTSLWGDREFSGWCAPIALRLTAGQQLYADGAHIPVAPGSFLVLSWLFGENATWLSESATNWTCIGLLVLVLYAGLSRYMAPPVPFLAALATIPLYAGLAKVLLYDGQAQLFAGCAVVLAGVVVETRRTGAVIALAVATALCIWTKQSTGAGVVIGAGLALVAFAGMRVAAAFTAATIGMLAILVLVSAPWIDVAGFWSDVVVHGSEPKGGAAMMLANLGAYAPDIARVLCVPLIAGAVVGSMGGRAGSAPPWVSVACVVACATGVVLMLPDLGIYDGGYLDPRASVVFGPLPIDAANAGLGLSALVVALAIRRGEDVPLAAMAVVAFGAAVSHALSGNQFRWTYETNPMLFIAFAVLLHFLLRTGLRAFAVGAVLLLLACWSSPAEQLATTRDATVEWRDVGHLAGAKLRPRAGGMHVLVDRVRQLAAPGESVLLLPDDPNVAAWFDRPRPDVSSAILFVDQYRRAFVDDDFARLVANPPKVIVIGPDWGVRFQHLYTDSVGQLINRVSSELLPTYEKLEPIRISYQYGFATLDVYVRR